MFRRGVLPVFAFLLLVLLAACGRPYQFNGVPFDPIIAAPKIIGAQSDGTTFDLDELRGKVVLLFFGYTFCPDICPLALADMKAVVQRLGDRANETAVVFVTLDPERDTPERLDAYMRAFDPSFIGVQTSLSELEAIKKGYGVYSEKRILDASQSAANYLVDHTGWTYLIDAKGDLRAIFSMDATPEQIAADVSHLVDNSR